MSLLAIAYPELSGDDFRSIENFRKQYDKQFQLVKPHFTLVFLVHDFSIPEFSTELKKQLEGVKSFSFCLRSAVINKDAFTEIYHVLLVPEEGFDDILQLHDKLYSARLASHHRQEIDFIPHVTIGSSPNKMLAPKMADEWNAKNFSISGVISSIDLVKFNNEQVTTLEKIKLMNR